MSDGGDISTLVVDSATWIFRDRCDPQTINNAVDQPWKEPLWRELEDSGLTHSWIDEDKGGAGVGVGAGFDILNVSGQFAVPVPLAETMLGAWLLAQADIAIPEGPISVAPCAFRDKIEISSDGVVSGTAHAIPFGSEVPHLAVLADCDGEPTVALVETAACTIAPGATIAGDPSGNVVFDGANAVACAAMSASGTGNALMLMGAAVRARQMAGALQAILDMSVAYAQERVAFGRPIGKFQAIQHNLARLAGEIAASAAVSGSAADAIATAKSFDDGVFLEIASAKVRVGEASGEGAAIAHQVFGAIGFTQEHILHRYTQRLWAWRDQFGTESEWAERIGRHVATEGADELWPMLAAR